MSNMKLIYDRNCMSIINVTVRFIHYQIVRLSLIP